jgi:hypothetical protein
MQWVTTAYRKTEKSMAWYVVMSLILLLFIAYDLFTGGYIVSITFLILAGVYYMSEMKPVPMVEVVINELGIRFGRKFFHYDEIDSFWLLNEENARHLKLKLHQGAERRFDIIISDEINLAKLREYLRMHISEEQGKKEAFSDQVIRNLGF